MCDVDLLADSVERTGAFQVSAYSDARGGWLPPLMLAVGPQLPHW